MKYAFCCARAAMCQIGDVLLVIVFLFFLSFFSFPRWCEVMTSDANES